MFLNFKFNNLFNINRDIFEVKEIINRKGKIKMKRIVSKAHYTNFLRPQSPEMETINGFKERFVQFTYSKLAGGEATELQRYKICEKNYTNAIFNAKYFSSQERVDNLSTVLIYIRKQILSLGGTISKFEL